ncbi:hexokinase [Caloramator sp. E03]|uniref:hexokinase family protein n=1 Tax=Caloramator sp. E03 TaxID=2576307 RepID=UPI0011106403|nr:hexokinase [Caloramator sp. E03]QCX33710.1 hexokinase [Caloramator sp. E03]
MDSLKNTVINFLKKYDMYYEDIHFNENRDVFLKEMEDGLCGNESSLKMIPTYISVEGEIPVNEPVIVMDAGGTNFRVAVVSFNEKLEPTISDYNVYPMPGSDKEISKEEFYDTVVDYIEPVINKSKKIGFCFSYPTEVLPNKDGKVLQLSKQVKINGIVGDIIGENLIKRIKERGLDGDKKIVILNDTVATLLGGKISSPKKVFDSYIGFILGTGTNTCYIEDICNIKKISNITDSKNMIINIESGGFANIKRGLIDKEMDMETVDKNQYIFEKMISGRYLGPVIFNVIKKACDEGILSKEFSSNIAKVDMLPLPEVSEFLEYPYFQNILSSCCANDNDRLILFYLIDFIIERAAKLVAINLAAVIVKSQKGNNPLKPICITADGSTFYKLKDFRKKLDFYVKKYINDEMGYYIEFTKIDNAPIVGAAVAGLIN